MQYSAIQYKTVKYESTQYTGVSDVVDKKEQKYGLL